MRDEIDPYDLAALSGGDRPGWGPHTHTDSLICQVGEAVERLTWTVIRVMSDAKPDPPAPWRRPGVLGTREIVAAQYEVSRSVYEEIEAEREQRRREREQVQQLQS